MYQVLIIGAGKIGAFFDDKDNPNVLTHAHAFYNHPAFSICGFLDQDSVNLTKAVSEWGGQAFSSLEEAFENDIDVVVVATPDSTHAEYLDKLHRYPYRCVIVEKPIGVNQSQLDQILKRHQRDKTFFVNYSRRYLPVFIQIRDRLQQGEFGELIFGQAVYGKGLKHNGSHMIDLIRFLFGDIDRFQVRSAIHDFSPDDPSISGELMTQGDKVIHLDVVSSEHFTLFELELTLSKGKIRILEGGSSIELYKVAESSLYKGYDVLNLDSTIDGGVNQSLAHLINHVHDHLSKGIAPLCTLDDGYKAVALGLDMNELLNREKLGGLK